MAEQYVTHDACQRSRESMFRGLGKAEDKIEELMDVKEAVARLTIIQEQLMNKPKFWESEFAKKIVYGFYFVFVLILLVALGQNLDILDKIFK